MSVEQKKLSVPVWKKPGLWLRKLYDFVLSWANTPYGTIALAILAFAESSFFPIPPDVLLIALSLGKPKRAFFYALVCSIFSVLGGMFGYFIGFALWESVKDLFIPYVFSQEVFDHVGHLYQENAGLAIFTAAFTPIPYKVFTIAAGVWHDFVSLQELVLFSAIGRPMRFFLVASLLFFFGPPVKRFIEKYFDLLALIFTVLLIGGFVVLKRLI